MRNVLLAVDGSRPSEEAAKFLARLPHFDPVELTLVSVVHRRFVHASYSTNELVEKAYEQDCLTTQASLQRIAGIFDGANVHVKTELIEGAVGESIVQKAKDIKADLVVVGATGHSQISRMLLGSTSDFVATHAPCSVLVVRSQMLPQKSAPLKVCLGYEGTGPCQAALEELMESPWRGQTELNVVLVANCLNEMYADSKCVQYYKDELSHAKEQLEEVSDHVTTHFLEDVHYGEGITRFVESHDINLVVLGETPRSQFSRFLLGSTSQYVLRHVPCSVWITRNRMIEGLKRSETTSAVQRQ
ncbi:universal stress protein [Rhodopirellula bahusiensis]|uniref:Universal stress protein n=1 Tax=Rhodopirellula bahusiensis TaxID=2014065 RepID=A0A2G1W4G9_9BACT|nr:universal stress protein [Rhodopirellula bahusiensis]PHQ33891.1 universal stress protein [Rhodopirellula bahusiensis]